MKPLNTADQQCLNQGKEIQQHAQQVNAQEIRNLQESTFAQHDDDAQLEAMHKREICKDDPMTAYAAQEPSNEIKRDEIQESNHNQQGT
jgi:hypothetical protein